MHHRTRRVRRAVAVALSTAALTTGLLAAPATATVTLVPVTDGLSRPLFVTHAGDDRLFVAEKGGLIRIVNPDGTLRSQPFLDISGRIVDTGSEQGLLGLAFHPAYATNRRFYVNYTRKSDGAIVIAEFRRSKTDPNVAIPTSKRRLLVINQPTKIHHGGWMAFKGNNLYISTGDGGRPPKMRSQNLDKLLGKILRINPLDPDGSGPRRYSTPSGNPYVGLPGRNEIWSYGLRNPWRCSFDRADGRLWCADVGEQSWEEVNRSQTGKGINYAWPLMEGSQCYTPPEGCDTSGKTLPVAEYSHTEGCSITGGYVARRPGADLEGRYIFGDFCRGSIWAIASDHAAGDPLPVPTTHAGVRISSFGEGRDGRIYLTDLVNGVLYYVQGT